MKKYKILYLIILSLLLTGCFFPLRQTRVIGSGNIVNESRTISSFSAVELSGMGTLIIKQGIKESLEIIAEDNIIPYLTSRVSGKHLKLGIQENVSIDPRKEIIYYLTVEHLEKIENSGLGNIEVEILETNNLDVDISGSGSMKIDNLLAESFKLDISGIGNIKVAGRVEYQRINLSDAGNYDARDLYSKEAKIEISGSGKGTIWVEDMLDAKLSGLGNLRYYGSPILNAEISGNGNMVSLGEK